MSSVGDLILFAQKQKKIRSETGVHAVAKRRVRRAFSRFQTARQKNGVLAHIAREPAPGDFNTCTCGQYKPQSAKYCYSCLDARTILQHKIHATVDDSRIMARLYEVSRLESNMYSLTAPPHRNSVNDGDDIELDRFIVNYEENLGWQERHG